MKETLRWKLAQYFEKRWWKNYLSNKTVEDYRVWKKDYWKKLLAAGEISLANDSKVLDTGCGPAGVFIVLENQQVTAIDPLLIDYEKQLQHFNKSDYKNVDFIHSPIENFKRENYFDFVFCMNAINHVQDYETAMNNLTESLKPSGVFILTIDAHNYSFFKLLFRAIPGDILHPHQYNLNEYKSHLLKRGVEIEKEILLKKEFFFNHYMIIGRKNSK